MTATARVTWQAAPSAAPPRSSWKPSARSMPELAAPHRAMASAYCGSRAFAGPGRCAVVSVGTDAFADAPLPVDTGHVLELRPNCECCDRDLDPASPDVLICTYECTWCRDCAENILHGVCPNCGGELVRRPIRPGPSAHGRPAVDQEGYPTRMRPVSVRSSSRHLTVCGPSAHGSAGSRPPACLAAKITAQAGAWSTRGPQGVRSDSG